MHIHIHTYIRTYTHTYVHTHIYIHTHIHAYIRTHTYTTYTYVHTYIHNAPFVYFLILSYLHGAIPWFWLHKINTVYIYHCTVLTVGKPLTQNAVDGCMTPVTKSLHLPSLLLSASCAVYSFTDNTNTNHTTDS